MNGKINMTYYPKSQIKQWRLFGQSIVRLLAVHLDDHFVAGPLQVELDAERQMLFILDQQDPWLF